MVHAPAGGLLVQQDKGDLDDLALADAEGLAEVVEHVPAAVVEMHRKGLHGALPRA